MPAGPAALELADWQGVEELVGDQEKRPLGQVGGMGVKGDVMAGKRLFLPRAQGRRDLHEVQARASWKPGTARVARSASAISVPRPGPSSASTKGAGRP